MSGIRKRRPVTVVIVYPNNTTMEAGKAVTRLGVERHAYGGGDLPYGRAGDDVTELWHSEIVGAAIDLTAIGATAGIAGVWIYKSTRGHHIPCRWVEPPTTAAAITDEQIMALLADAQSVEAMCNRALNYNDRTADDARAAARAELARILNQRTR